ncbi:hypothetical protein Vadar_025616 [Vaccinium darrowii]|uniref:Uncharacterized protein n=1 Tax=Vaccinium darrowii TaxID=229202 RepID=A0ACB7Z686_9ERIC|nr:hypothetical protein Vadar_025616 [Vaccinium darrowii]
MPERDVVSWNAMVTGYWQNKDLKESKMLFDLMPERNVVSWNSMIAGCVENETVDEVFEYFLSMPGRNTASWNAMISGFVRYGWTEEAAMITGYCKKGKMENARILFEDIQPKDSVSFNAMTTGYAQNGDGEAALKLQAQMLRRDMKPDHSTLVSVLTTCSTLPSLKEGRRTHVIILKRGFASHLSICNALITMYSKCGCIIDSESAFSHLNNPDLVSWNTIIAAFAQHGLYEKAVSFFSEMRMSGCEPDGVTFLSLLSACGHFGTVNESLHWFDSMVKNYNLIPWLEHNSCLVDILGRAGQLEKAYDLIKEMPFELDSGIWGALLSGCCAYSNAELGQLAAEKYFELDPQNSGAYVVLSNIYAAAGRWKEVKRVRGLMKEQGVKKKPAYSWMETGNKVHFFVGGDVSHPNIEEIYS